MESYNLRSFGRTTFQLQNPSDLSLLIRNPLDVRLFNHEILTFSIRYPSHVHLFNYETPLIIAFFKLRNSLTLAFQLQTPLILVFFFFLLRNSLTLAFQLQNPSDLSFF